MTGTGAGPTEIGDAIETETGIVVILVVIVVGVDRVVAVGQGQPSEAEKLLVA